MAEPQTAEELNEILVGAHAAAPKIPTAAEIIAQREALKQAELLIETHAANEIDKHIASLVAIGKFYELVERDAPAAPSKPRATMKCGNCGTKGHRKTNCKQDTPTNRDGVGSSAKEVATPSATGKTDALPSAGTTREIPAHSTLGSKAGA